MTFIILILSAVLLFIWRMRHTYWPTSRLDKTVADVDSLRKLQNEHDIAFHFLGVVESDGDGQWPPKVSYDAWPAALMPYKAIWNDAVPLISDPRNNIYGNQNGYKIKIVRDRLKTLLTTSVALSKVNETLSQATHRNVLSQRQYNGFCCCIAFLRHTYRWGTNPIITSAQRERVIDFPDELALPWRHIQRHFGFTSESGTVMSNFLLNINEHGNPEHVINQPLSQDYRLSEFNFYCMFYEMERLSVPVYHAMIHAMIQFNKGEKSLCRKHMGHLNETFDKVFDSLSGNMHNGKMLHYVWMRHIQGFHAWGTGKIENDAIITYSGLSGGHMLIIQALDAFTGLPPLFSTNDLENYIPRRQRDFVSSLQRSCFRWSLGNSEDDQVLKAQFQGIIKRLKRFRATHRARALPYVTVDAPERTFMTTTAASIQAENPKSSTEDSVKEIFEFLDDRLSQTK